MPRGLPEDFSLPICEVRSENNVLKARVPSAEMAQWVKYLLVSEDLGLDHTPELTPKGWHGSVRWQHQCCSVETGSAQGLANMGQKVELGVRERPCLKTKVKSD